MSQLSRLSTKLGLLCILILGTVLIINGRSASETASAPLPIVMALPSEAAPTHSPPTAEAALAALLPTLTSTPTLTPSPTLIPPTAAPLQVAPDVQASVPSSQPIPAQMIIRFEPGTTPEQQNAYLQTLGGRVVARIESLHTVVVTTTSVSAQAVPQSNIVAQTEPDYYVTALNTNDPYYPQQWALPVIKAPEAWDTLTPDTSPIAVAVIDSGICATHPDLQGRILPGYDFVDDDITPQDTSGHGCGVAGIIAAKANNGLGMAGVAPHARIMPLRVLNAQGQGSYSDVAAAMVYAVDNGAAIINLSLGGSVASSTLENAVAYAVSQGVLVIAAAGNTGGSVLYPAAYDAAIAVGSVDQNLQRSNFSNYGPEIDLFAPGRDILTTSPSGGYTQLSGTSFAAPQVAGVAALELARNRNLMLNGEIVAASMGTPPYVSVPTIPPSNAGQPPVNPDEVPVPTNTWAVILSPGEDPNAAAAQLGYENLGQIANLPDTYLFRAVGTENQQVAGLAISAFQANAQVIRFEQQFAYRQSKRDPNDDPINDPVNTHVQWHFGYGDLPSYWVNLNVRPAWANGFTGSGVQIAIVDDGLQHTHPDLQPNYNATGSFDFNGNDADPSPYTGGTNCNQNDCHGTSAAGLAAAADNPAPAGVQDYDYCGVGVAYDADLAGIRLIAGTSTDAMEANALTYQNGLNDIYSNSWGPADDGIALRGPEPLTQAAIQNGILNGRGGLGSIFVWAAGNGRQTADNVNADGYANSRYVIAVGATDYGGNVAYYSEPGAAMLVTAPSSGDNRSVATTDLMTSDVGYNGWGGNTNYHDCTDGFGGTSASTPMVAGVVALMLQANPNLTWRDVQHILVETATQNNPGDAQWTTNDAGYPINHDYGFGLVNADAAVTLAQSWTNVEPEISYTAPLQTVNQPIPFNMTGGGLNHSFTLPANIKVEHVEVILNVIHSRRGDLEINLTAPSGTSSQLMNVRYNDWSSNFDGWKVMTVRNWGEHSAGSWTLNLADRVSGADGSLVSWQIIVYGTPIAPLTPSPTAPIANEEINTSAPTTAVTFRWNNSLTFNVDHYELQIDTVDPLTAAPIIVDGNAASYTTHLSLRNYFWRIRAIDPDSKASEWSDVRSFTVTTPANAPPLRNFDTTGTPLLTWGRISWATQYRVQVATDSTFTNVIRTYDTIEGSETEWTVDPPLGDGVYYWRVTALNANGQPTTWSSDSFAVDVPS